MSAALGNSALVPVEVPAYSIDDIFEKLAGPKFACKFLTTPTAPR